MLEKDKSSNSVRPNHIVIKNKTNLKNKMFYKTNMSLRTDAAQKSMRIKNDFFCTCVNFCNSIPFYVDIRHLKWQNLKLMKK